MRAGAAFAAAGGAHAYFGGCRPGLNAHFSAFSLTSSWLGRTAGFGPFGIFGISILGSWMFLSMAVLHGRQPTLEGVAQQRLNH